MDPFTLILLDDGKPIDTSHDPDWIYGAAVILTLLIFLIMRLRSKKK